MKKAIAATALAAVAFTGCSTATTSPERASTYQDSNGNRSQVGSYEKSDAYKTWNASTSSQQAQACANTQYGRAAFMQAMSDGGYPASDSATLWSFLMEVC